MTMTAAIIIMLYIGMIAGTTFDDLLQKVRETNDDTAASPDAIGIAPEDEADLLDNSLGGDTYLQYIYFIPNRLSYTLVLIFGQLLLQEKT